jgi:menaquinone-specific isochorismate synthase
LAKQLLNSTKDIYEHDLVCQFIEMGMKQLCNSMEMDNKVSILRSENVQHLYKKFWGTLKEHIGDPDIISTLHPTPAIGGVPKEISFQEIREIEKFDRGWYAGPIGWVRTNSAEFAVGIRSGLVIGDNLHLYSGSGIVPDSDPELEWQEIEQKISHFMKLFQA